MATISMYDSLQDVRRYWRRNGPLWSLFWIYGVLASTVGGTAILASVHYGAAPWVTVALVAAGLAYTAWVLVGVWRCAFNMSPQPFGFERETLGWMARLLTIGWAINAVGGVPARAPGGLPHALREQGAGSIRARLGRQDAS